ncbi:thiol:disulfide interchange protein DsbA/DsbL [Dokdonella sp.]|uniref:thiol:disulfide interchange protein DsbA/DsbL n=1 Tax=Dokdonella sp. TaxID=2291710 RepID=UPI003C3D9EEC
MLKVLFTLGLGLGLAANASAQAPAEWQEGKHYTLIEPPQATTTGDKVEVLEVFSYACPHCNEVAPMVADIKKRLPATSEFVMIPAQFGFEAWKTYARAFYTAQALGILDKSHEDMFRAIYVDKKLDIRSPTFASLAEFYSQYGVSVEDFTATSRSFAIETRLKRNDALIKAYGVESTPNFIVNGKYLVSGQTAGGYNNIEALLNYLVAKESAGS